MATLAVSTETRKAPRAYYAHLYDQPGTLIQVDGEILFIDDLTEEVAVWDPLSCLFLTVLGEMGLADTQAIMDRLHGGAAAICTSRQNLEV